MKLKAPLIGLMTLVISFQTYATTETRHYPTGEKGIIEYVNGKPSKVTLYSKTGEVKQVEELVNDKLSRVTHYYKTGEVKQVVGFVNGKESRRTFYHKTGEIDEVQEYVNGKLLKGKIGRASCRERV